MARSLMADAISGPTYQVTWEVDTKADTEWETIFG